VPLATYPDLQRREALHDRYCVIDCRRALNMGAIIMDNSSVTTDTLDHAEEELFTVSTPDEALEAAAGTERAAAVSVSGTNLTCGSPC